MKKGAIIGVLALVAMLFSCEDDVNRYDKYVTYDRFVASEYFNFRTSTEVTLNLNYGEAKMKMPISVYTSDPSVVSETTGEIDSLNAKLEPVFRGFTENDGTLSIKISVPSEYSKIYVANQVIGRYSVSEVPIKGVTATLDLSASKETRMNMGTRAGADEFIFGIDYAADVVKKRNPYNLSDKLGKWNSYGLTEAIYVDENAVERDAAFQNRVVTKLQNSQHKWNDNTIYAKGADITNVITQQEIKRNEKTGQLSGGTEVVLHFLYENAGFHSVLGYYYYNVKDRERIDTEPGYFKSIPKYIAMPNCTWDEKLYAGNTNGHLRADNGKPLQRGSSVKLKYYGADYSDEAGSYVFPDKVEIGWFILSDAFVAYDYNRDNEDFKCGDINGYSLSECTDKDKSGTGHVIYLKDNGEIRKSMWFPPEMTGKNNMPYIFSNESQNKDGNCGFIALKDKETGYIALGCEDGDSKSFADVIFYIQATPNPIEKEWDDSVIEPDEPSHQETSFTKRGILAFEDLWPSKGDYDMNDVVIEYESTITLDADNFVTKIVDKFTPKAHVATYTDAFGYELSGISPDYIESVSIDRGNLSTSYFQINDKGLEANQGLNSVIMLYNNQRDAVNQGKPITVTIEIDESKKLQSSNMKMPPYNPFIVAQANLNAGEGRKEVHLPKDYRPTLLAGELLKEDDKSVEGCWYVANPDNDGSQYPFAITIPYSDDFKSFEVPAEGVKISEKYPKFIDWSKSKGTSNKDWYRYPNN